MSPDHPRSRGVYEYLDDALVIDNGSSPLARGLLFPLARSTLFTGIIPARAGFTQARARAPTWVTDHPRSRGVYVIIDIREL